jgi:chromate reductase, NAD(P)H dehydrogenase (quinone)
MNVLAIPGSLRAASINAAFCRAAADLAPAGMNILIHNDLGTLPLFNPDLEDALPPRVAALRAQVASADAVLIASPEYAHGIAGSMKNALDWLVAFEGFAGKPVAAINTAPRAHHAYNSLREVLQTMSATIVPDAWVTMPLHRACAGEDDILRSPELSSPLRHALIALYGFLIDSTAAERPSEHEPIGWGTPVERARLQSVLKQNGANPLPSERCVP